MDKAMIVRFIQLSLCLFAIAGCRDRGGQVTGPRTVTVAQTGQADVIGSDDAAKTPRPQRSKNKSENNSPEHFLFPFELGAFAALREEYLSPRVFDTQKVCARRANSPG